MKTYPVPNFTADDKVAYSVQFLQSIGASHSDLAHARGTIIGFTPLGAATLAEIRWNKGEFPARVNTANLAKVGPNPRFCNVD